MTEPDFQKVWPWVFVKKSMKVDRTLWAGQAAGSGKATGIGGAGGRFAESRRRARRGRIAGRAD
jgi:hypothetical protein